MRTPCDVKVSPIVNAHWWNNHVQYSKFRRQGIDIVCASFQHPSARANIILVTGLSESFVKYSELVQYYFERGFNIHTYDHQSQGLSGRWLVETQSLWVNSFDDYVDDFIYFTTTLPAEGSALPLYLIAHSMGGFISAIAMSRLPTLIKRAVLCAPMIRNKCGLKCLNYKFPIPQPLAYYITAFACYFGLGSMHALGYFKERPTDYLPINVTTSDQKQLNKWQDLRMKYPQLITTCVTNDWVLHSIRAQKKFYHRYEFVRTNTLLLSAETDYLVYNRAIASFLKKAPAAKMFAVPESYHELLAEKDSVREATMKVIHDFFSQNVDDVSAVQPCYPLVTFDPQTPIYSMPEMVFRGAGLLVAAVGFITGFVMLVGDRRLLKFF